MAWAVSIQPSPTPWLTGTASEPLYCRLKDRDTGAVGPSLVGASFSGKLVQGATTQPLGGAFAVVAGGQPIFTYTRIPADVGTLTVGRWQLQFKITLATGEVIETAPVPVDVGAGV